MGSVGGGGEREAAEEVDSVPVEAALYDEDVVADEKESRRQDAYNGNGYDGEACVVVLVVEARGPEERTRLWACDWRE